MENLEKEKLITVKQITDTATIDSIATKEITDLIQHIANTAKIEPYQVRLPLSGFKSHSKAVLLGLFDMSTRQLAQGSIKGQNYKYIVKSLDKEAKLYYLDIKEINNVYNYIDFEALPKYYSVSYVDLPLTKVTFGLYKAKMKQAGVILDDYMLSMKQLYTLNKTNSYMVEIKLSGIKSAFDEEYTKFVIKDIDFIAKFSSKGYNLPKDREVKIGALVKYRYQGDFYESTIIDIKPGFQQYNDKKGKPVRSMYYYVNHNGRALRFKLSKLKIKF